MTRFKGLPHWCMTGTRPAFFDTESATTIEMVGRLYASYSELVDDYNKYVDEINKAIMDFETGVISDTTTFKETITKIVHDYIKMIDDKVKIQDATIEEAVSYMKSNIIYAITETVNEMKTSGELAEIVVEGFNDAIARITALETNLSGVDAKAEQNIDDILDLKNRVKTAENTVSTMESKVNQSVYTVDSLSKEVGSVRSEMSTLSSEVAGVKTTNTNLNRSMTTLTGRVDDNETSITHLDGLVAGHETNISNLESRVSTLETTGGTGGSSEPSLDTYSTEETVIGTWVDGKPIYRKCFVHQFNGTYDDKTAGLMISFINSATGASIDSVIKLEGKAYNSNFDRVGALGNSFKSDFGTVEYRTNAGNNGGDILQIGLNKDFSSMYSETIVLNNTVIKIIMEYTKK